MAYVSTQWHQDVNWYRWLKKEKLLLLLFFKLSLLSCAAKIYDQDLRSYSNDVSSLSCKPKDNKKTVNVLYVLDLK